MTELLSTYGIHIATTVSKADYVLVGDDPSPNKLRDAEKRNKNIIYEVELKKILNE